MEAKNINSSFFKKPYISLESTDLEKSSNIEKVICILVWLIIQTLGNFLIIGIIQYERFGGDPLKRRITDQVKKGKIVWVFLDNFLLYFQAFHNEFHSPCNTKRHKPKYAFGICFDTLEYWILV